MPNPITGLPKGHVPHHRPPADRSALFATLTHTQEARALTQQASDAEWAGDTEAARTLYARAAYHRSEAADNGELQPLF